MLPSVVTVVIPCFNAAGTQGRLRIRTEGMVEGYLGEPELMRRHFRNGWFYPDDMTVLDGRGRLRVVDRGSELLHIGGAQCLRLAARAALTAADGEPVSAVCSTDMNCWSSCPSRDTHQA